MKTPSIMPAPGKLPTPPSVPFSFQRQGRSYLFCLWPLYRSLNRIDFIFLKYNCHSSHRSTWIHATLLNEKSQLQNIL